jgi:hypothetical protein
MIIDGNSEDEAASRTSGWAESWQPKSLAVKGNRTEHPAFTPNSPKKGRLQMNPDFP